MSAFKLYVLRLMQYGSFVFKMKWMILFILPNVNMYGCLKDKSN